MLFFLISLNLSRKSLHFVYRFLPMTCLPYFAIRVLKIAQIKQNFAQRKISVPNQGKWLHKKKQTAKAKGG